MTAPHVGLQARGLSVHRGPLQLLDDVHVDARPGEPLAVVGPSGSGKSTLLAVLSGLQRPDAGDVTLDGQPLAAVPHLRRRVAVVLQGYGLVSLLTAAENVEVVLRSQGLTRAAVRDRTAEALDLVGLADRAEHLVEELSGGEQQRVALARALAVEPDVLLADEPTAELDAASRARVLQLLAARAEAGLVLVVATHDLDVAATCPQTLRLAAGRAHSLPG